MQTKVKNVRVAFVEEGKHCGFAIIANDAQGREYVLLDAHGMYRIMSYTKADMVVGKIKAAKNIINPMLWSCVAPYGTEGWLLDGMQERELEDERFGYY